MQINNWISPIDPEFKCINKNDTFFKILRYNNTQKLIINNWMNAYIKMYNETVSFIKKVYEQKKKNDSINIPIEKSL